MEIIKNWLPFVNEQITIQRKLTEKFSEDWRKNLHTETEKRFLSMADDLQTAILEHAKLEDEVLKQKNIINDLNEKIQQQNLSEDPSNIYQILALKPEELAGLPSDILDELSESARDKTEVQILEIINSNNGLITLDQLLVRLYTKFGEKFKRPLLTNRLYKMVQAKVLYNVPGKKGVYSTNLIGEANYLSGDEEL